MRWLLWVALAAWALSAWGCAAERPVHALLAPDYDAFSRDDADKTASGTREALAPVYPALAEFLTVRFGLAEKPGIGIDLGGGSGPLTVELARQTRRMYWVDVDINSFALGACQEAATKAGLGHRVGALFGDAQRLPFRSGYADFVVSRGSLQFWEDRQAGFAEIWRVLKPGGVAWIGRGFPENLPPDVARAVRDKQKGGPQYDIEATERELRAIMAALGIRDHRIVRPAPAGTDVNYGIWVTFAKPAPGR